MRIIEEEEIDEQGNKHITLVRLPDQFIVVRGACKECPFTPERVTPAHNMRQYIDEALAGNWVPACHITQVAEMRGRITREQMGSCYGFYYQFWRKNLYLRQATEERSIQWLDITGWPGLREEGLSIYQTCPDDAWWYNEPIPEEDLRAYYREKGRVNGDNHE